MAIRQLQNHCHDRGSRTDIRTITMDFPWGCINPDIERCWKDLPKITTKAANLVGCRRWNCWELGFLLLINGHFQFLNRCWGLMRQDYASFWQRLLIVLLRRSGWFLLVDSQPWYEKADQKEMKSHPFYPIALAETDKVCSSVNIGPNCQASTWPQLQIWDVSSRETAALSDMARPSWSYLS